MVLFGVVIMRSLFLRFAGARRGVGWGWRLVGAGWRGGGVVGGWFVGGVCL